MAVTLAMLTVLGPISMDLYLPVLPALAKELIAGVSAAQLTMTACLFGLAFGQVVAGPISDRYGRRVPLIIGVVLFIATSGLCAASPTIEVLIVLRFAQGLAGAVGLVIAQASGRDVYEGNQLTRYYSRIIVLSGLAAIVAPVLGGQLAALLDWRGFFIVLAGVGAVMLVVVLIGFRETLPARLRVVGGIRHTGGHLRTLLSDRLFVGAAATSSLTSAAYFAYLGGASFVLQDVYQLSAADYSLAFGLNAAGFALFGFLSGRATERFTARQVFGAGLAVITLGSLGVFATAVLALPVAASIVSFFTIAAGAAVVSPPATNLALADYPQFAGTASSVLGVARFAAGGIAAPLVGLGGASTLLPLAIVATVSSLTAIFVYVHLVVPTRTAAPSTT